MSLGICGLAWVFGDWTHSLDYSELIVGVGITSVKSVYRSKHCPNIKRVPYYSATCLTVVVKPANYLFPNLGTPVCTHFQSVSNSFISAIRDSPKHPKVSSLLQGLFTPAPHPVVATAGSPHIRCYSA